MIGRAGATGRWPWWARVGLVAAIATAVPTVLAIRDLSSTRIDQQSRRSPEEPLPAGVRELAWTDLMPPGWDPRHPAGRDSGATGTLDTEALAAMADDDPQARRLMAEMRDAFERAPVRPDLDGQRVRLRGYVVPLAVGWGGTDEFLLVPYYGACIHSPPPPPNQIVHVKAPRRIPGVRSMAIVTVTGRLDVHASASALATSGYRLTPETVRLTR
ncbi:DUF3299 domain-containing protein [Roseateles chitosanitabidus]|uniref:DUF3299 domain-containing protein n=1 Tax=Roseateles chitosanitabidus TaxID=65048 RepID=UPI000831176C|nr:DUF3299 domain-containing protein [Roseateles chitosanitabidus]